MIYVPKHIGPFAFNEWEYREVYLNAYFIEIQKLAERHRLFWRFPEPRHRKDETQDQERNWR